MNLGMDAHEPPRVWLLERLRHNRGVSLAQIVEDTGLMHKTIRCYERAPTPHPQPVTLKKLADYYGVEAADLLADMRSHHAYLAGTERVAA